MDLILRTSSLHVLAILNPVTICLPHFSPQFVYLNHRSHFAHFDWSAFDTFLILLHFSKTESKTNIFCVASVLSRLHCYILISRKRITISEKAYFLKSRINSAFNLYHFFFSILNRFVSKISVSTKTTLFTHSSIVLIWCLSKRTNDETKR